MRQALTLRLTSNARPGRGLSLASFLGAPLESWGGGGASGMHQPGGWESWSARASPPGKSSPPRERPGTRAPTTRALTFYNTCRHTCGHVPGRTGIGQWKTDTCPSAFRGGLGDCSTATVFPHIPTAGCRRSARKRDFSANPCRPENSQVTGGPHSEADLGNSIAFSKPTSQRIYQSKKVADFAIIKNRSPSPRIGHPGTANLQCGDFGPVLYYPNPWIRTVG